MSKEYIEREALIEELKRRDFLPVIVKQAIEAVPAADVAPVVHAHWIEHIDDYENYCECSNCHENPYGPIDETMFCPNCGARMDGKESR